MISYIFSFKKQRDWKAALVFYLVYITIIIAAIMIVSAISVAASGPQIERDPAIIDHAFSIGGRVSLFLILCINVALIAYRKPVTIKNAAFATISALCALIFLNDLPMNVLTAMIFSTLISTSIKPTLKLSGRYTE